MSEIPLSTLVAAAAFGIGLIFGIAARASDFCTMGALSDWVYLGETRRLRAWMLAMAVALAGTQVLHAFGRIDLSRSLYLSGPFAWGGAVLGGLAFGYGMTLAGGCGSKTLVRLGGGNLKSLVVVLVTGLFATMTVKGLLAHGRIALDKAASLPLGDQSLPTLLGLGGGPGRFALIAVPAGAVLLWCLSDRGFRRRPRAALGALVIGTCIPAGWAITGILGADEFEPTPLASYSFIAPMGDAMLYLMTFTGATLTFGIAGLGGVVAGAFLAARLSGTFALEGFADTADFKRHLLGAALMGTGGVLAMGCTIGQGLSGLSTLSLTSILALAAIITGGVWGLRALEEGGPAAGLRAFGKSLILRKDDI